MTFALGDLRGSIARRYQDRAPSRTGLCLGCCPARASSGAAGHHYPPKRSAPGAASLGRVSSTSLHPPAVSAIGLAATASTTGTHGGRLVSGLPAANLEQDANGNDKPSAGRRHGGWQVPLRAMSMLAGSVLERSSVTTAVRVPGTVGHSDAELAVHTRVAVPPLLFEHGERSLLRPQPQRYRLARAHREGALDHR
jgi:hypothetical protein